MTIDEAIRRNKETVGVYERCIDTKDELDEQFIAKHKQYVEWFEELKAYKELDLEIPQHFTKEQSDWIKKYVILKKKEARKDAIDEFIKKAEEEKDNIFNWDEDDYENGMMAGYQYSIEIAEKMKEGA